MKKVQRIALVGIGGFSRYHYDRIKELELQGELKLSAVMIRAASMDRYRPMAEKLTADGVKIYTTYEAMLEEERGKIDLVVLPTGIVAEFETGRFQFPGQFGKVWKGRTAGRGAGFQPAVDRQAQPPHARENLQPGKKKPGRCKDRPQHRTPSEQPSRQK